MHKAMWNKLHDVPENKHSKKSLEDRDNLKKMISNVQRHSASINEASRDKNVEPREM
jgi:hypothetical protein